MVEKSIPQVLHHKISTKKTSVFFDVLPRKGLDNTNFHAAIAGAVSGAYHVRAVAEQYGVPVILHTDHCATRIHAGGFCGEIFWECQT